MKDVKKTEQEEEQDDIFICLGAFKFQDGLCFVTKAWIFHPISERMTSLRLIYACLVK